VNNIGRRKFIQMSVAMAAGGLVAGNRSAFASDLPQLSEDDAMAQSMRYTNDASTVDASTRPNPAELQVCENCALIQGDDGEAWRPCQIFPGKAVSARGWCSVWSPRS